MLGMAMLGWCRDLWPQQPLAPSAGTTYVTASGVLHYSSIHIPAGVTVQFLAPLGPSQLSIPGVPAIVRCDGDVVVHGTLSVSSTVFPTLYHGAAGWVTTGEGRNGIKCGSLLLQAPGGGRHNYGTVLPFSLEGGSKGGWLDEYGSSTCNPFLSTFDGGRGGGTLVLHARGRIDVHGTVTAEGEVDWIAGAGSGGSILLRGDGGVNVFPGAVVTARGGTGPVQFPPFKPEVSNGDNGYIRLDAWGAPPVVQGVVTPLPTVIALPYLHAPSPPIIGTTWTMRVFAPDTGWVYVAASLAPASGTPTIYGPLGLDLASSAGISVATPQPGHDPHAVVQWPIPNAPGLVGFAMWLQAIAVPQSLPARVSNTIAVVVQ
jgi:hypothetical protein